jgi:hypothetical protein
MGTLLGKVGGRTLRFGKSWIYRFQKRNPEIMPVPTRPIEAKRITATTIPEIERFYEELHNIIQKYVIEPQNIWNFNENGVSIGSSVNEKVLV